MSDLQPQLFGAFLQNPQRRRWPVLAVVAGVVLTLAGLRAVATRDGTNIVTPRGVRTVRAGMTRPEVNHLLGRPFALADSQQGLDCYRYGYPNLDSPTFVVYSLCYQEARLRDISEQRYTAWSVSGDGEPLSSAGQ